MLSTHALSNAISTEPAQGSWTQKKPNLKQTHKCLFYPFCLHRMQTTTVPVWIRPQTPRSSLEVCLTPGHGSTPLVHDASWDQICHPVLVLPHLALLYSCSIQILSLTSTFISQSLPARSCKHVSHPLLHSGASPIAARSQTFPSSPTPADWRRPHWKHGAENITAGGFLQCEPNKTQTLPNNCYLQLK